MTDSIRNLISSAATHIVLACNTPHLFLEDIYKRIPERRSHVVNIIDVCVNEIIQKNLNEVYLLATEGTI